MALGNKEYNYNYYGLPVDRKWSNGIGEEPFAALVRPNIWGYQPSGIYYDDGIYSNADKNGKPLDDTIAVWRLPKNASFACNAFFSVDISSTLGAHYDVNIENSDVPLLCAAIDTTSNNWGKFDRKCVERYAYDTVNTCNGPKSALAYDINPTALCLYGFVITYDRATPATAPSGRALTTLANYIDAAPATRDLTIIRPTMYRGTGATRISTAETIPEFVAPYFDGILLADTSSNIPIPDGQTYLKSLIADTAGGHSYRNDVIYRPFASAYFYNLYSGANTNTYTYQLDIGFSRPFTKNQIISGAATISGANKITAQLYRCNYDIKSFDDVVYQWENVIFDTVSGMEIQNGLNLNLYSDNPSIRFYTRLKIIDDKGNSKGKAVELAVKHELAYIGFYFADTQTGAESAVLGSNGDGIGVYLPEKIGGVTTGRYFTGDDIKNVPYADADSTDVFRYEPLPTDDTGDFSTIVNTGDIGAGVKYYALTEAQMNALTTWLNTTYTPTDETQLIQDFKGVNPADYITGVMYYPFDVPIPTSGTDETLKVGKLDATGAVGRVLKYSYGTEYSYGSYDIPEHGNYLDYMRKISVIVPFCGTKDLDPLIWTGHRLTVKMQIDFPTGVCTAFLYRDNCVFDTLSGSIGVPLPLSALANGSYQVSITNMLAQKNQATIGGITRTASGIAGLIGGLSQGSLSGTGEMSASSIASVASGAINTAGGIASTVVSLPNLDYNIAHTVPEISQVDGGSPFINCGIDYRVKILICTPVLDSGYDAGNFGKTTGYACCKQGVLSQITSGYTECAGADLSGINATSTEKAMIFNALKSGVIV